MRKELETIKNKIILFLFEMDMSIFSSSFEPNKSQSETSMLSDEISTKDIQSTSNKILPYPCTICQKEFSNRKALQKHLKLHLSVRSYKCSLCNKAYKRSDHLTRHMLTHNEKSNIYKCPYCDFSFYLKYHLKSHMNNIHVLNPYKFKCEFCGEYFPKKIKMLKHQRHEHKEMINVNKVKCYYPYCHKEYLNQNNLEKHIEKDHMNNNNQMNIEEEKEEEEDIKKFYKCPYENCLKTYSTSFNLNTHIKSFHLKIKAFECDMCKMSFSHKSSLKRHMENIHHKKIENNIEKENKEEIETINQIINEDYEKEEYNNSNECEFGEDC